jgi:hypothetical protein
MYILNKNSEICMFEQSLIEYVYYGEKQIGFEILPFDFWKCFYLYYMPAGFNMSRLCIGLGALTFFCDFATRKSF